MIFRICCLLLLPIALFSSEVEQYTLFIFQDAFHMTPDNQGKKGLAQMMSLLEKERESTDYSFTLLNGPFLSPLYFSGWDRGEHVVDLLNQMQVNGVLFEDHCFDYGSIELHKRMDESKFVWLSNNLIHQMNPSMRKTHIIEAGNLKIGMIAATEIHSHVLHENSAVVYSIDPFIAIQREIKDLREAKVDLILVFSNLKRGMDQKIARTFSDIDAIIGCGQENPLAWYEGSTLIYETGQNHANLDRIDFIVEKTNEPHESDISIYPCWRRVVNEHVEPHEELSKKIAGYQSKCLVSYSKEVSYLLYQIKPQERYRALIQAFQRVYPIDGIFVVSDAADVGSFLLQDFFVLELKGVELKQILDNKDLSIEFWDPSLRSTPEKILSDRTYTIGVVGKSDSLKSLALKKFALQQIDLAKMIHELQHWSHQNKDKSSVFKDPRCSLNHALGVE